MTNFSRVSSCLFYTAFILSYCWFPSFFAFVRNSGKACKCLHWIILRTFDKKVFTQRCKFCNIIDRSLCARVVDFNLNIQLALCRVFTQSFESRLSTYICTVLYANVTSIMLVYSIHLWYWTSMFWSIDTCQNKVSAHQYHMTISQPQA